jgi:hypothetical protein
MGKGEVVASVYDVYDEREDSSTHREMLDLFDTSHLFGQEWTLDDVELKGKAMSSISLTPI